LVAEARRRTKGDPPAVYSSSPVFIADYERKRLHIRGSLATVTFFISMREWVRSLLGPDRRSVSEWVQFEAMDLQLVFVMVDPLN
jgi:hypothetical protein